MQNTPLEDEIGDKAAKELLASERAKQAKYTPAPWKIVKGNAARTFNEISIRPVNPSIKGMVQPIAKVMAFDWANLNGGDGLANAQLIAAAPELLEALQMCVAYMHTDDMRPLDMNKVRDAINKALGVQA